MDTLNDINFDRFGASVETSISIFFAGVTQVFDNKT